MNHVVTQKSPGTEEPTGAGPTEEAPTEPAASAKKERVLHTRVPAVLEQELKRFARNLRVPVSNLVRVILEDALQVADKASGEVEQRLRAAVDAVSSEREQIQKHLRTLDPLDGIIGYQPFMLAQEAECASCHDALEPGGQGWLGLRSGPGPQVIVCQRCIPSQRPIPSSPKEK